MIRKAMLTVRVVFLSVLLVQGAAEAQGNMNVNRGGQQRMQGGMMGGLFGMGGQVVAEDILVFLKGQGLTDEATTLEGLMRDRAKAQELETELMRLNMKYGMLIRQMEFDPEGAKRTLARMKLEGEITKTAAEAEGKSGNALAPIRKKLVGQVGQLFDMVIVEEEARMKQMAEFIRTGDMGAMMMGMGRGMGMGAGMGQQGMGRGQQQGMGRGQQQGMGRGQQQVMGRGQQQGMGRGIGMGIMGMQMDPSMFEDQLKQSKANFEKWKKNKATIVNIRVQELLLGIEPFPWRGGGMGGMMRIF